MHPFHSFRVVTLHELSDALRSRRAVIFLVLYLLGALSSTVMFLHVLHKVEVEAVKAMGLTPSQHPGTTTEILWKSDSFRNMMYALLRDRTLADRMLSIPPVALFYSWLSFTFTPLLVILLSSSRIAEEVGSACIRYSLFRAGRAPWALGKFAGQALLLLAALAASALGTWIAAMIRMPGFEPAAGALHLFLFSFKAWLYALAFLGLALGISQTVRSAVKATALGLFALVMVSAGGSTCILLQDRYPAAGFLLDLFPQGYRTALWNPDWTSSLPAAFMLTVLALGYFLAGYAVFARRDA